MLLRYRASTILFVIKIPISMPVATMGHCDWASAAMSLAVVRFEFLESEALSSSGAARENPYMANQPYPKPLKIINASR